MVFFELLDLCLKRTLCNMNDKMNIVYYQLFMEISLLSTPQEQDTSEYYLCVC